MDDDILHQTNNDVIFCKDSTESLLELKSRLKIMCNTELVRIIDSEMMRNNVHWFTSINRVECLEDKKQNAQEFEDK